MGRPMKQWTTAATMPAAAGMGIPTKYLRPGLPGFWDGVDADVEAGQAAGSAEEEKEADEGADTARRCSAVGMMAQGKERNPQAKARMLGATPKVMTSARESSSLPKSLAVLVMRAMRPSRASKGMARPMARAA